MKYVTLVLFVLFTNFEVIFAQRGYFNPIQSEIEVESLALHLVNVEKSSHEIANSVREIHQNMGDNPNTARRIIKNNAMYRYVYEDNLEESFLFLDDYRFPLVSTYEEVLWLGRQFYRFGGRARAILAAHFDPRFSTSDPISGMMVSLLNYRGSDLLSYGIPYSEISWNRVSDDHSSFSIGPLTYLLVRGVDVNTNSSLAIELSRFQQGGKFSHDYLRDLYDNYARLYIHTSEREITLYMSPGGRVLDFLRASSGGLVSLSDEGKVRRMGDDTADILSLGDMENVDQNLWIQYPGSIDEETVFTEGMPYIFIYTTVRDILSLNYIPSRLHKTIVLDDGDTETIDLGNRASYYASIVTVAPEGGGRTALGDREPQIENGVLEKIFDESPLHGQYIQGQQRYLPNLFSLKPNSSDSDTAVTFSASGFPDECFSIDIYCRFIPGQEESC